MVTALSVERWSGAKSLIFSVPYTDIKILAIIDKERMRGAIYNPYRLTKPMPWLDRCPHCREGLQGGIPVKIRRAIQVLCSIQPDGPDGYKFTLPNRYRIGARRTPKGWGIRIRKPGNGATLHVVKLKGKEPVGLQESAREFRSPILLRTLKMLFSAMEPSEKDTQAILSPLRNQNPASLPPSQKTPCWLAQNTQPRHFT
jgi:hypothetical protein